MSYLRLADVSYTYPNGYQAVQDINLSFNLGEAAAIIGQNGAGKTTTVKLMNGLLKPSKGQVFVDHVETSTRTTAQIARQVGYVFQNPDDQIFQETIFKEIAYGLVKQKLSESIIQKRVQQVADLCGLADKLQEHPYNLPYSKRKFVTIAAVIAMHPKVIILDEPTAGQDRQAISRLKTILNQQTKENRTVITITHDMEFVAQQFNRVIVFANKQKRKEGTPQDIFWDQDLLQLAKLKQSVICQLAKKLGYLGIMDNESLLKEIFG